MKVIILAGGSGTRLWPLSRGRYPKQFIKFQEDRASLFQETFERSLLIADKDDIYVVTNKKHKFLAMGAIEELGYEFSKKNILLEPEAKNTLPAVYCGIHEMRSKGKDTVVVFPSDHKIAKNEEFIKIIKSVEGLAHEAIVTFGVKPDEPNTGYGYISKGIPRLGGYEVSEFKEKPNKVKAAEYVEKGYLWNSGIFMFASDIFEEEVKKYANGIHEAFNSSESIEEAFGKIDGKISMDYGILERSNRVAVVPVDIGWNDLGSYDAFYDAFDKDDNNNIFCKDNIAIDSKNNIVNSEKGKLVALVGVEDLIVADNRDALLICRKDQSQKVKDVVDILNDKKDIRTEFHIQDYRPWGYYKILDEEKDKFKIKRITVASGKKLSYQMHHSRSEHWVIVRGTAKVTIDDKVSFIPEGESIFVKAGQKHRLENQSEFPLEIIEIQMGDYLEEDDIIRFDDEYKRNSN